MTDPNLHIIDGDPDTIEKNLNRHSDVNKNIANVRREFIGKPEVCHRMATQIIWLRREPDNAFHKSEFWTLLHKYQSVLLEHYDIRWLLSICDTIVDIGDYVQSASAMNIVQCINRCNLDTTLLINAVNGDLDAKKLRAEIKMPTWGGMITADVPSGDMIYNMMNRLDMVLKRDPMLWSIWCEIKDRSRTDPHVVMNHICAQSRFEHQRRFFQ